MKCTSFHIPSFIFFTLLALLATPGCRKEKRLYPFSWEAISPLADSLTLSLERGLYLGVDPDSLTATLALLEEQDNEALKGRIEFYRAAIYENIDRENEAADIFARLLHTTDSASSPYLYNRLREKLDPDDISPAAYANTLSRLEYFKSVDDPFMQAAVQITLGNLLKNINDTDGSITAYGIADSLLRRCGFPQLAIPIGINRAHALQIKGDSLEGLNLLRHLLRDPYIQEDPSLEYMILRNLITSTGDTLAAKDIKALLEREGGSPDDDCILSSYLSEFEFDKGNYPEALRLARIGYRGALADDDSDAKAVSMQRLADAFAALGLTDSAYYYLSREVVLMDSVELARVPFEIKADETSRIIAEKRMEKELNHGRKVLWVTLVLFVVFVCLTVAATVVAWRIHSLRLARAKDSVEREKAHRRLIATQILVEEKDALLNNLSRDLSQLEEKGEISAGAKGHIAAPIKTHIGQTSSRVNFLDTFSELHPEFVSRLKDISPELTDTDIRLAKLIAVGLDNKQIASTLSIRPESVKQARWRLRSKLHLASGSSLEDYLKTVIN